MSGVSGASSNSAPTSTGGVGDALLKLASFVQTPEYVHRVAELSELEARATAKHESVTAAATALDKSRAAHDRSVAEFERKSSDFDVYQHDVHETLATRETDVNKREAALTKCERDLANRLPHGTARGPAPPPASGKQHDT